MATANESVSGDDLDAILFVFQTQSDPRIKTLSTFFIWSLVSGSSGTTWATGRALLNLPQLFISN